MAEHVADEFGFFYALRRQAGRLGKTGFRRINVFCQLPGIKCSRVMPLLTLRVTDMKYVAATDNLVGPILVALFFLPLLLMNRAGVPRVVELQGHPPAIGYKKAGYERDGTTHESRKDEETRFCRFAQHVRQVATPSGRRPLCLKPSWCCITGLVQTHDLEPLITDHTTTTENIRNFKCQPIKPYVYGPGSVGSGDLS